MYFFPMAKLDLSALKKQNIANEIPPASSSHTPQTESAVVEDIADAKTIPPAAETASTKSDGLAPKTKLSLLSMKKSWVVNAWADSALDASVEQKMESASEVTTKARSVSVADEAPKVLTNLEKNDTIAGLSDESTSAPLHISHDHSHETWNSEASESETKSPVTDTSKAHPKASSSEFFPNLGFENNELFSDIMEMGSVEEKKDETAEKNDNATLAVAELETNPISLTQAHAPVVSGESVENLASETPFLWASSQPLLPESSSPLVEPTLSASQSESVVLAIASETKLPDVLSQSSQPISTAASGEPVEAMEKNLSRDRKGGLSALFENKKKAIYGISVMLSLGVVALLFWLGIFGESHVMKSSGIESVQTVAKNSENISEMATTTLPGGENNVVTTPVVTTLSGTTQTGSTATTLSGATAIVVASESVTQTGITASGWVQTSVNTYRAPNISVKRPKQ